DASEKQKPLSSFEFSQKNLQIVLITVLSVVFIVLLFVLVGMMRTKMAASKEKKASVLLIGEGKKTAAEAHPSNNTPDVSTPRPRGREKRVEARPQVAANDTGDEQTVPFVFGLKAHGEVWVQVKDGEKNLYAGVLKDGESKTWKSDRLLTVWTGKGEMLDFYLNTRKIGNVANGVVKNIKVTSNGIKIGDEWAARF
ncbi:MAG: RodZ domain-containing protein, partial [Candidatus Omnitrophota bacterium]